MEIDERIKEAITDVMKDKKQLHEDEFIEFIKNFVSNNCTDDDILDILNSIKINKE